MKQRISRLLILCILLCGCAKQQPPEPLAPPDPIRSAPQGLYDTGSHLEISSLGAVRVFPLGSRTGKAIAPFAGGILLFSAGEQTTLTLFSGDTLVPKARQTFDFSIHPAACITGTDTLSFYDPIRGKTLVLDTNLEVAHTIDAPAGLVGEPLLTPEGTELYYATPGSVRCLDLSSGISRTLKEVSGAKAITQLCCGGDILRYEAEGISRFLSTGTGELLGQADGSLQLFSDREDFAALLWETNLWSLIFQLDGQEQTALTPRDLSSQYYPLLDQDAVVTGASSADVVTLDRYDLVTGQRTATQMYRGGLPLSVFSRDDGIWFLAHLTEYDGMAICRWDPGISPVADPVCYTGQRFTAAQPDREGLRQCQADAHALGQQYGIDILVWEDAVCRVPDGHSLTPEHRVNILNRELELLDHRLSQFPPALLEDTASNFDALTICLVAKIQGDVHSPGSLQFFDGPKTYIILEAGNTAQQGLYHSLFHVMETHILGHSSAFDRWDTLNPQGFQYDYSFATNAIRNSGIYLTESNRYFLDTFSMSYPKEDRARVFEYAMLEDSAPLFRTPAMQKKLSSVCAAIRQAYGLTADTYPWEQHCK